MNGPHDLGGQMGFGPLPLEADEPLFHAPWESRALGLTLCCGALGHWTIDEMRHARESLPPATYLSASYYEIWIRALQDRLDHHGLTRRDTPHPRKLPAERVAATLARGGPTNRPLDTAPRFRPGDRVRTRRMHPATHTRLPRYLRDTPGVIESHHGGHVFPDGNAHGQGEHPQHLYTVTFKATDVWGPQADTTLTISADLWESYLETA